MSSTLVVGYDGSECAQAALRAALTLGHEMPAKVVVAFAFAANPMGGEVTDYREAINEHGARVLQGAMDLAREQGVEIETAVVHENTAEGLVDLAEQRDARAIIVGTRGEGPIRGALIGSTPHKLLQLADRPVLVVPA
jgi:nucleotide-binding universal stress UspA family protein